MNKIAKIIGNLFVGAGIVSLVVVESVLWKGVVAMGFMLIGGYIINSSKENNIYLKENNNKEKKRLLYAPECKKELIQSWVGLLVALLSLPIIYFNRDSEEHLIFYSMVAVILMVGGMYWAAKYIGCLEKINRRIDGKFD